MSNSISTRMDWQSCQTQSDQILSQGVYALRSAARSNPGRISNSQPGNYLVSLSDEPLYVGEAKDLSARLKQQFTPKTSTFYKNYQRSEPLPHSNIHNFQVRFMETRLGRKEIEDFGIVNIPTRLNRFQLDKRERFPAAVDVFLWQEVQAHSEELLTEGERAFLMRPSHHMLDATPPNCAGLYAVWSSDDTQPVYIGESSDIGKRHRTHCQHTYFSALRRHVGTSILGFSLQAIKGKRRYFSEAEDRMVTDYLRSCMYSFLPVALGRLELEEHLIRKHQPLLNRKGNRPILQSS